MPFRFARRAVLLPLGAALLIGGPARAEAIEASGAVEAAAESSGADETIIVYGERQRGRLVDAPVATEVIDRTAIERAGARTVADVLETRAGVTVERTFAGAGVSLLGLDPRYTLVLVDGERVVGQIDGAFDVDRLPVEQIERIEIIRGAASAAYGADGIGGVVNIITRRPARALDGSARLSGGSDLGGGVHADVGGPLGPVRLRVSGGFDRLPSYDLDPGDPATSGSTDQRARGRLRAAWDASRDLRLNASADYELRSREGIDSSAVAVFDRRQSTEAGGGSLGANWSGRDGSAGSARLRVDGLRDQYLLDQRGASAEDDYEDTRLTRVGLDARHALLLGWHRLTVGVDGEIEHAETPRIADGEGQVLRAAVFAEDEWTALDGEPVYLALVGGARLDVDGDGNAVASPRLSLRIDPHETVAVRASGGLGFRPPTVKERFLRFENPAVGYIVDGNPDVEPERAYTLQAGVTWRPLAGVELHVEGARASIDDLITFSAGEQDGDRTLYRYVNVDEALTHTLESGVRWSGDGLRAGVAHRFTEARDVAADRPLEGRPRHQIQAEIGARHRPSGLGVDLNAMLAGERPYYEGEDTVTGDPYIDLDARAEWVAGEAITLYALGENLLDAGDALYLPLRPRRFSLGIIGRL